MQTIRVLLPSEAEEIIFTEQENRHIHSISAVLHSALYGKGHEAVYDARLAAIAASVIAEIKSWKA